MRLLERLLNLKPSILSRQALAILRSYGTNAHVYLPGIGTINGLTAGNYLLADGSTGTTPVDGLVGLDLDAAGSVGAELITNGDFSNGTTGWSADFGLSLSVVSGALRALSTVSGASARVARQTVSGLTVGATYRVTASVLTFGGAGAQSAVPSIQVRNAADTATTATITAPANTNCTISGYFVATDTSHRIRPRWDGDASTNTTSYLDFDDISVREVTGTHATAAGAARPTLRRDAAGRYSHQYSGAQSLALGSVPFQMADDFAIIAAYRSDSNASNARVFYIGGAGAAKIQLFHGTDGTIGASLVDDASAFRSLISSGNNLGAVVVGSIKSSASISYLRKNGVSASSSASALGAATFTGAAIGSVAPTASSWLTGSIGPVIAIKGTVTDADLLTLERFVSSLTPNGPSF